MWGTKILIFCCAREGIGDDGRATLTKREGERLYCSIQQKMGSRLLNMMLEEYYCC